MDENTLILTPREWQVLELMRRGFADHQIAQVLGITEGDARRHVSSVADKLQLALDDTSASRPREPAPTPQAATADETAGKRGSLALKIVLGVTAVIAAAAIAAIGLSLISEEDRATAPNGGGDGDLVIPDPIDRPAIGTDHWHAAYEIIICGEEQPPIGTFDGGVHTHSDGIIHIHPTTEEEEGRGASLVKFFEYAGGNLGEDTITLPGGETYTNGDQCPNGGTGFLHLRVNGQQIRSLTEYIPQHDDQILIEFGPDE